MLIVCPKCYHSEPVRDTVDSHTCSHCGRTVPVTSMDRQLGEAVYDTPSLTETFSQAVIASPSTKETTTAPESLGRYRIQRMLGEGGYSWVYLAFDEELERLVALKVPKVERFPTEESLASFFDEARTVAGLEHPNIVRVYDVGRDPSTGTRFIVMQHVEGQSLHERIKSAPLSLTETAQIVGQAATAIHFAHKRQFFHRDLKPSNILLDDNGKPYVADFGLAVQEQSQREHAGEFAGTLPYMAPEQIRGESHRLDGRTDIWSLGVVLYRVLTGRVPFSGDNTQIIDDIQHREPRPPRQIDESIPRELERVTLKCLNKSVGLRYSSGFDLAEDLQAWLDDQSESSRSTQAQNGSSSAPLPTQSPSVTASPLARGGVFALACLGLVASIAGGGALFVAYRSDNDTVVGDHALSKVEARSWNVDQFAVHGRWYALLDVTPKEVVFSKGWDAAGWHHDPEIEQVHVDMPDIAMLEIGETAAREYRLQVTIAKSTWDGNAGIFWAYEDIADGLRIARCRAIEIVAFPGKNGTQACVQYNAIDLLPDPTAPRPVIDRHGIYSQEIPVPHFQDNLLEIRVRDGQLISAHWRGQPLDKLSGPNIYREFVPPPGKSRFGLVSSHGASVFCDARYRLD